MYFFDLGHKMVAFRAFRRDGTPEMANVKPDAARPALRLARWLSDSVFSREPESACQDGERTGSENSPGVTP
jgi:hypothetical protein